jgi:cation:H+ antiporter
MLLTILLLAGGLVLLYIGAEGLVRGSTSLALRLGLTRLVVGLTIVAFGTSSPELVVSVKAALDGSGAISLGNVIGSNICNIALILGLSALLNPIRVHAQVVRVQTPIMIVVSIILVLLLLDGNLNRWEGLGLLTGIIAYVLFSLFLAKKEKGGVVETNLDVHIDSVKKNIWLDILIVLAGLAILVLGAKFFVSGAVSLARALGISQAVIGLTIVALGTSLPELATSVVAALRKEGDISVGNVIGSNIFNILAILGIASLMSPINLNGIRFIDLVMMIILAILTLPITKSGFVISRREGIILLVIYGGYIFYLLGSI